MAAPSRITMNARLRSDYRWTERQRQVLGLLARGKTNAEIATALQLQLSGVKWHISEILSKLDAESREEAAEYWRRYNGIAPRFARVFRGFSAAVAGKSAIGIAAIGALGVSAVAVAAIVARAAGDSMPSPRPSAAGTIDQPTRAPDPRVSTTTEAPFEGFLAGIQIMPKVDDINPFEICPGVGLEPLPVPQARAAVTDGGLYSINLGVLPSGVSLSEVVAPDVWTCRGVPVSVFATFTVEPGTPDVNPGGGSVLVSRTSEPPQLGRSYPRSAWTEVTFGSRSAVILSTPTGSSGEGCLGAYWDEPHKVFTSLYAFTGEARFCETMLRAVVE